ncbi:DUF2384 domain-containing protein [Pararobbsia alpina]|uniref:hypothetical protein n=1 Tax=Pararobbsia alpina TaxID=621374 RepID=UPI0039A5B505
MASTYKPEYDELGRNYCLLGATDEDIARFMGITARTLRNWKTSHPSFAEALEKGKAWADSLVARSLYDRAIGGDTTACIFWLKNRQKHAWRDRHEIDHSGKVAVDPIQHLLMQVEGSTLKPKEAKL